MRLRSSSEITKSVIFALILREMRGRFGRVRFGALWTVFEPLAHMVVLGTVISIRRSPTGDYDFLVWLLMGVAPFLLFKNIAIKVMNSVDANKALFSYKQIQPADAFCARAIIEFCVSALVFSLIYVCLSWYGRDTSIQNPVAWLIYIIMGVIFSLSLGILYAIIVEAIPETKFVLTLTFLPLYFLSGVIFSLDRIPPEYMQYVMWNPYLHFIDLIRASTFDHYRMYAGVSPAYIIEVTVVTTFLALALYRVRRLRLMAL